ncbi:hypothetical protein ACQ33O_05580 [Ferruginibacter sp. SUN002]|uniref:hypothetical protein n=1 Tax=Ferruginibacter sp. SUN002 TaxID=2937789 RepID=UPI003D3644DE
MYSLRTILYSFTIWVLAAMINALLSATLLIFSEAEYLDSWPGVFVLALVFSLLFSAPGIFIFWLVFISNTKDKNLFRLLLRTGIICSAASGLLFVVLLGHEFKGQENYLGFFGVVAAITAIMIHHRPIVSLNTKSK